MGKIFMIQIHLYLSTVEIATFLWLLTIFIRAIIRALELLAEFLQYRHYITNKRNSVAEKHRRKDREKLSMAPNTITRIIHCSKHCVQ